MSDHAQEVRNLLVDAGTLCGALGWMAGAKPNGRGLAIRCPAHPDKDPSCGITHGEDGTLRARCHACGWSADALGMIAHADGLDTHSADDFREIMAHGAEIGGDLMLADEIRNGRPVVDRKPVPLPPPEPPREYPDQTEVLNLWSCAAPITSDATASALLKSRSIDPDAATERALLRVFGPSQPLPGWATYQRASWRDSGHRVIARVVDSKGAVRSVRSWQVDGKSGPKRLPPTGHRMTGLVLVNREAAKVLAGKSKATRIVICEGEPDWATWATRVPEGVAVFGIGSGSWTKEHADKLPKSSSVYVRTHCDEAGEKYAANVIETIGERCAVWRLNGPLGIDENDKAKAGKLPEDPAIGCEPSNAEARKILENTPRIFTVQQLLCGAHARAIDETPAKILTTGHWKIDMLTGGIRLGFSWVVGADTSWGKSSWAIACMDENLKAGAGVLVVSIEDDEEVYGDRLLARRSGVDAMHIRDRRLSPQEHSAITAAVAKGEPKPCFLDGRGIPWERLLHMIHDQIDTQEKKGEPISLVILDYIQECFTKKKYGDDRLMFKAIGQQFRHSLKRRKVANIALSQLTIDDPAKAPTKRNIRECKDLSSGAEVVALGWSPTSDITENGAVKYTAGAKILLLDKVKNGRKGSAELEWDESTASFNRVLRPANEGYDIPGFEKEDFDDLDDQFPGAF